MVLPLPRAQSRQLHTDLGVLRQATKSPMKQWWLAIVPGPRATRVVLMNGAGQSVLRGRLPYAPWHPEAPRHLCETLALWCEGAFTLVLAVVGSDKFYATKAWCEAFASLARPPNCLILLESRPKRADFAGIERQLRARMRRI
jgi:hypothetical protein